MSVVNKGHFERILLQKLYFRHTVYHVIELANELLDFIDLKNGGIKFMKHFYGRY